MIFSASSMTSTRPFGRWLALAAGCGGGSPKPTFARFDSSSARNIQGGGNMASAEWKKKNQHRLREYRNRWYAKNRKLQIGRQISSVREKRAQLRKWIAGQVCADCGLPFAKHPEIAEFHHLNPATRNYGVGDALKYGKRAFEEEKKKCVLICANCHRIRHTITTEAE